MPKLNKNERVVDQANKLLTQLAKNRKINKRPEKLSLSEEQKHKAELIRALEDMEKNRQLNESKKIMGALDSVFKKELYRISINLMNSNRIGYSCRDIVVFNNEQINQPVPARTLNIQYDLWLKNYFFDKIWKCFFDFEIYLIKKLNDLHIFGVNFKIYDHTKISWSPIKTKELEILIYEFFENNKNYDAYELLFRLICLRLNEYILNFNNKNKLPPDQAFIIYRFIFNDKELKLIDELTDFIKQKIMLMFPEYKELFEKHLKPMEKGKSWIKKVSVG